VSQQQLFQDMNVQNPFLTNPVQVCAVTVWKFYLTWIIVMWRGGPWKMLFVLLSSCIGVGSFIV
jgi:hypothetical protein